MACALWCVLYSALAYLVYRLVDYVLQLPYIGGRTDKYVLITGCDSGFGHETVQKLDKTGVHVFAGCFTEQGEKLVQDKCSSR